MSYLQKRISQLKGGEKHKQSKRSRKQSTIQKKSQTIQKKSQALNRIAAANPNSYSDVAIQYIQKIKDKYPGYIFDEPIEHPGGVYLFYVKVETNQGLEKAGSCELYIDEGEYAPHNTISEIKVKAFGIKVNSIITHEGHTGKRLGIALLFYSICWLYINRKRDYKYIRLDDATNGKDPLDLDNFYIRLGFVPEGRVALPSKGKQLESKGSDEVKIASMEHFINVMLPKEFGKLGGYRKKRTMRANQIRSKSKRNKRTIRVRSKRSKRSKRTLKN